MLSFAASTDIQPARALERGIRGHAESQCTLYLFELFEMGHRRRSSVVTIRATASGTETKRVLIVISAAWRRFADGSSIPWEARQLAAAGAILAEAAAGIPPARTPPAASGPMHLDEPPALRRAYRRCFLCMVRSTHFADDVKSPRIEVLEPATAKNPIARDDGRCAFRHVQISPRQRGFRHTSPSG